MIDSQRKYLYTETWECGDDNFLSERIQPVRRVKKVGGVDAARSRLALVWARWRRNQGERPRGEDMR